MNPVIQLRGACYLLVLVAVSAIPFALAQREATRVSFRLNGYALAPASCLGYTFTLGTATFVPGVTDTGNHCDDCFTGIALPFSVQLYDQMFTTANVGSNGALFFGTADPTFAITCSPFGVAGTTYTMGPYWTDQVTNCTGCGIFTTTTGTAPNRVFYIEYLTNYFIAPLTLDYEVALYENGKPPFQFIYNTVNALTGASDSQLVVGVKKDDTTFTQYGCDTTGGESPPVSSGQALTATCVQASPTPTPTPTVTATPTPTATPRATPRPRPTPHSRPSPP